MCSSRTRCDTLLIGRRHRGAPQLLILAENYRKGAENTGFIGRMRVRRIFGIEWWARWRRADVPREGGTVWGSVASTEGSFGRRQPAACSSLSLDLVSRNSASVARLCSALVI